MRLTNVEARLAKLEADPRHSALARYTDDELDRRLVVGLNELVTGWPSFGALVAHLRGSEEPGDSDLAKGIEAFIVDWRTRHPPSAAQ